MPHDRGHRQLEHTADLALRFWAPTEAELLVQGAQAVIDVLTDRASVAPESWREITLETVDAEDRLVQWLNEILILATMDDFVMADAELSLRGDGLTARVRGQPNAPQLVCVELKSVTYHQLELRREADRWVGQVVIDV